MPNKAGFHQLLWELLSEVANVRRQKRQQVYDDLAEGFGVVRATVESWFRTSREIPSAPIVEDLVRYIAAYGLHDDARLKELLDAADHHGLRKLEKRLRPERHDVPNNLPSLGHDNPEFVGRRAELRTLLGDLEHRQERLNSRHVPLPVIEVTGPGGVGKTELVLQAAYKCLQASNGECPLPWVPPFRAIVFASAKQHRLERRRFVALEPEEALRPVRDIYRRIAGVLGPGVLAGTPEGLEERVLDALATRPGQTPVLLILDNLEVLPLDVEYRLADFLYRPPLGVKIVYTSRNENGFGTRLNDLSQEDAIDLMHKRAAFHRLRNPAGLRVDERP